MPYRRLLSVALAFASVLGASAVSFATDSVVLPQSLSEDAFGQLGYGFYAQQGDFANMFCVKAKSTKSQVVTVESQSFAAAQILTAETSPGLQPTEVRVVFRADSKAQKVLQLQTVSDKMVSFANPNKEGVCGTSFLSGENIGASIILTNSFQVSDLADKPKLVGFLKSKVTDLHSLMSLDISGAGVPLTGGGLGIGGAAASETLRGDMSTCFAYGGKACTDFVTQAYAEAAALDQTYPASRVGNLATFGPDGVKIDAGDIISYTMRTYAK